jgi:hypothetical protein
MTLTMMNTHKAFKRLQRAGINDRQAEAMVDIFSALKQDNALSRADVMQAFQRQNQHIFSLSTQLKKTESCLRTDVDELKADVSVLKTDVGSLKNDMRWVQRLLMIMTTTLLMATIKYVLA